MNNLFFSIFLTCSLFNSNPEKTITIWKGNSKNEREIKVTVKGDSIIVPFIWKKLARQQLNDLIPQGKVHDSILDKNQGKLVSELPMPVIYRSNELTVLYAGSKEICDSSCCYDVITFWVNEGSEVNEEHGYQLYYIKGIGTIKCFHVSTDEPSIAWDKYILSDVKNTKDKSIIDVKHLNRIISQLNY